MTTKDNSRKKLTKNIRRMAETLGDSENKKQFAHAVYFHLFNNECPEDWEWKRTLENIDRKASEIKKGNWSLGKISALFVAAGGVVVGKGYPDLRKIDMKRLYNGESQSFCSNDGNVIEMKYQAAWDSIEPVVDFCKTVNLNGAEYLKQPLVYELKPKDGLSESSPDHHLLKFFIPDTGIVGDLFKDFLFEPRFTMEDYREIRNTSYIEAALGAIQTYIQENPELYINNPSDVFKFKTTKIKEMVTGQLEIAVKNYRDELYRTNLEATRNANRRYPGDNVINQT